MPGIYLQQSLDPREISLLKMEFPHYDFLSSCSEKDWSQVEILYGNALDEKEFKHATRLRWIHCPSTDTDGLCLNQIHKRETTLVSLSKGQNVAQIGEFVIGAILAFAKQFFHWKDVVHDPQEFWAWPLKDTMWTLKDKVLLQIGLGEVGSQIVKTAATFGMCCWGMRRQRSFHPYCRKTFPLESLHSLLPRSDIVSLALPKKGIRETLFKETEFNLMKPDSILIIVGSAEAIDESALVKVAKKGKFRGVLIDAFRHPPPAKHSPLWEIPNGVLTPSVAALPEGEEHVAFRQFRQNLRLFVPGRISEMKNLVT